MGLYKFFFKALVVIVFVLLLLPSHSFAQTTDQLEAELATIEAQIKEYEAELTKTKTEKQTLTKKITQLKKEQSKIELQIRSINVQIKQIGGQLTQTESSIKKTTQKLQQNQERINDIINTMYWQSKQPLLSVLLADGGLPEFFKELQSFGQLMQMLATAIDDAKTTKAELENQYVDLEHKQEAKKGLLEMQVIQRESLKEKTSQQDTLLKTTQGKEAQYQAILADTKARAKAIRSRIYELLGVNQQFTFGEAVKVAQWASDATGVRPAFLLAILTQESNLGKNVGTCNRPGDPPTKSWRVIMKPTRDHEPFLAVTKALGMDPDITPVSCPMRDSRGNRVGWGGAMGPAQFIPSTWVGYQQKVTALTGKAIANPWDLRDAFAAAAIKLKAGGAGARTEQGEWRAAMLYFSGSTNTRYRFYGDNVLSIARDYEDDMRALQ